MANKIYLYRNIPYMEASYNIYEINGHKVYFECDSQIYDSDVGYYYPTSGPYDIPADDYSYRTFSIPCIDETGYADTISAGYDGELLTWSYSGQSGSFSIYYFENDNQEENNYGTLDVSLSSSGQVTIVYNPVQSTYIDHYSYILYNSTTDSSIISDYEYLGEEISSSHTFTKDLSDHMSDGNNYTVTITLYSYAGDGNYTALLSNSATATYSSGSTITPVTASIALNATTGVATWSYSANTSDISFYEPYVQLWDPNDQIMDPIQIADSSYDFSSYMSSGNQYYATLRVEYYDYNTSTSGNVSARSEVITYSPGSTDPEPDPDEPSTGTSFNARMRAIANAIRLKASISDSLNIKEMITTLNGLTTTGSPNYDTYVSTNFDSCMTKLSKVIRSQNGTISNTSGLTISQMPDAIASIVIKTSSDNEGPLTLYITTGDGYIEINSNAYMYSDPSGTISWYGDSNRFLYSENIYSFDGATYSIDTSYVSTGGEFVYAEVSISSEGYGITRTSDSFWVIGSGNSCANEECTESTGCCEDNEECTCLSVCQSCEGPCEDGCESECQTCQYGCQD